MSNSWFKKGEEGIKEKQRQDAIREERQSKQAFRFWLKEGASARILFLDDDAFFCYVHQFKHDGSWNNYATCVKDIKPCPICETDSKLKPVFVGHYTILDLTSYTKKDGTTVKYSKKILPAKGSAIMRLNDLKKKYGSLKGLVFEVKRYTTKDPNCGSTFDYEGKISKQELKNLEVKKKDLMPFNFEEILQPPTDEEYAFYGFSSGHVEGSDWNNNISEKEEEPFIIDEDDDDLPF